MATFSQAFLFPLMAGLAVFLAGMKIMETALQAWTGGWMKTALARLTRTPLLGLITGAGTTAVLQSSSAVTVVTVGMVNAGVLTFPRTLGIILGTNIGTCLTTELIGLNVAGGSPAALAACFAVWLATLLPVPLPRRLVAAVAAVRRLSLAAAGFCGVLFGVRLMQGIVPYLQEKGLLVWFLEHAGRSLLWGIVAGAVLTAVIHSSSAAIAMTMSLAALGVLPVPLGIAIVLGSNIGTCLTALLAGLGGGRYGRYVAYSHIMLNVAGAALFYPFIDGLHALAAWLAADPAVQIARAQTLFNVICSVLALPVCYLPALQRLGLHETAPGPERARPSGPARIRPSGPAPGPSPAAARRPSPVPKPARRINTRRRRPPPA